MADCTVLSYVNQGYSHNKHTVGELKCKHWIHICKLGHLVQTLLHSIYRYVFKSKCFNKTLVLQKNIIS